ncbi:MAG: GNAT family N-acetyltransferase [Gammaproteobacteria bacterium]|nr:GNAT family N-acetyltransferase [Gammaproteobacteria bacterium]MAY02220.1 GNAT family N-acetyltransferase [Gammaproteobacteria bacterium]|tara:strand:- start:1070 stop:1534 length:465 start_codon:yes stop_codon:yes gene_type:complete
MQIIPLADKQDLLCELAELHHAEWSHLNPTFTLEERVNLLSKEARRIGIPSIYIAILDKQLLGSAAIVQKDMKIKPDLSPWLAAVFVKEEFRHQGIASALIQRCEQEAITLGIKKWYLFTEHATALYEKLGWKTLEKCDYRGNPVVVMYKSLNL